MGYCLFYTERRFKDNYRIMQRYLDRWMFSVVKNYDMNMFKFF